MKNLCPHGIGRVRRRCRLSSPVVYRRIELSPQQSIGGAPPGRFQKLPQTAGTANTPLLSCQGPVKVPGLGNLVSGGREMAMWREKARPPEDWNNRKAYCGPEDFGGVLRWNRIPLIISSEIGMTTSPCPSHDRREKSMEVGVIGLRRPKAKRRPMDV